MSVTESTSSDLEIFKRLDVASASKLFARMFRTLEEEDKIECISGDADDVICFLQASKLCMVDPRAIARIYINTLHKQVCDYILENYRKQLNTRLDDIELIIDRPNHSELDLWKLEALSIIPTEYPQCDHIDEDGRKCSRETVFRFCIGHGTRCEYTIHGQQCPSYIHDGSVCCPHHKGRRRKAVVKRNGGMIREDLSDMIDRNRKAREQIAGHTM